MDENAIHQWLIECFGPIQGELAWSQFSQLPDAIRNQMAAQDPGQLPKPSDVQALLQAFSAGGLNTPLDMADKAKESPINVQLAKSIALGRVATKQSDATVSARDADLVAKTMSEANLWLDSVSSFDPAPGRADALTRAGWVEGTMDAWARFASPVAQSMNDALSSVLSERLGGFEDGQISGMFAGPVPIPLPDNLRDPATLMKLLGNTSFSMQLGRGAGELSSQVRGGFDQGIPLLKNPAGALIPQNIKEYADSLQMETEEVMAFLALHEAAHARLFSSVPWLMPRFEALTGKYARGISIDLDAMEEQLREAAEINPESIQGAINLSNVGIEDTPEQVEALHSLENLLTMVEGWVDCVVWRAGMAHIPHIEQLREMNRRERAVGGPAQQTFESLLGLHLHPKRLREAAGVWEGITNDDGYEARDSKWGHPDLLPRLDEEDGKSSKGQGTEKGSSDSDGTGRVTGQGIDWDAELARLLDETAQDEGGRAPKDDASDSQPGPEDQDANDGAGTADGSGTGKGSGRGKAPEGPEDGEEDHGSTGEDGDTGTSGENGPVR
ncbi:zinc-dependent metalloprotease [Bifidobacterium favimelis]|uniref:Zinc-dependent metalloprotease n=1 Tax=Bifidobacterium favimelis TaxID=3122979 RepID=A0ABU8ZNX8_9BIFI